MYAIQLVEQLSKKGYAVCLSLYGEGTERISLEKYIAANNLDTIISLKGNQNQETVKKAYQHSHFVVLPSKSEGWPKAIAEGMFWGCVPVATAVSCVPYMLDYGDRGVLLGMHLESDCLQLEAILQNQTDFENKRKRALDWSRNYTLDYFEQEIKNVLKNNKLKMKKYILLGTSISFLLLLVVINYRTPFLQQDGGPWSVGYGSSNTYPNEIKVEQNAIYSIEKLKTQSDSTVFLADPFFIKEKDTFYLFFEHQKKKNRSRNRTFYFNRWERLSI